MVSEVGINVLIVFDFQVEKARRGILWLPKGP